MKQKEETNIFLLFHLMGFLKSINAFQFHFEINQIASNNKCSTQYSVIALIGKNVQPSPIRSTLSRFQISSYFCTIEKQHETN